MDELRLRAIGVLGLIILIVNIVLFSFRIITPLMFWMIIIIMAVLVYGILPKLKSE